MKLYTRQGDDGKTALIGGGRVAKDHPRIEAYGTIDELNALLAVAVLDAESSSESHDFFCAIVVRLTAIQSELFSLGAELATPSDAKGRDKIPSVTVSQVARLESWIDEAVVGLPTLDSFVLPGGTPLAARLHVCRTVCRRAERCAATLGDRAEVNARVLIYLNRLSDLLFAWARKANQVAGVADVAWRKPGE